MSVNKTILVGNVGADPEVRYTQNGSAVANFSLATKERYKDKAGVQQDKTEWHRVVIWGKLAEVVGEYVKKGQLLYLEGKNVTRKWEDNNGVEKYTTEVVCNSMQMLGSKSESGSAQQTNSHRNPDGTAKTPAQMQGKAPAQTQGKASPEPDFDFDDDIPF